MLFQNRTKSFARLTPGSPQVNNDGNRIGTIEYFNLKRCIGDVNSHDRNATANAQFGFVNDVKND
jgi:hypothetical protein